MRRTGSHLQLGNWATCPILLPVAWLPLRSHLKTTPAAPLQLKLKLEVFEDTCWPVASVNNSGSGSGNHTLQYKTS
ncbi:hypothetical protein ACLKA7_013753 [Drosophila subpalustris]